MCGVVHDAGGVADAVGAIIVCDGGNRGSNDLFNDLVSGTWE